MSRVLRLLHGELALPAFLPDATRGVVRTLDAADLEACRVEALMMNTFHLMQHPGSSTIRALGGLHRMSGWSRPIVTDSGGFQAYSVLREDPSRGTLGADGIAWRSQPGGRRFRLTPEKCIELQLRYGADVVICLDDCTHPDDPAERQALAVERTLAWARRAKACFASRVEAEPASGARRPLLFAVIQGGVSRELRKRCAGELLEIGFDGFGFGGWPFDRQGHLLVDALAFTRELVPPEHPMHALGVGHPVSVSTCAKLGYDLFDSALPTRDARRGRLYVFHQDPRQLRADEAGGWCGHCYVGDRKHTKAKGPVSEFCDALCCRRYSLGYLHHLHRIDDALLPRLATLHNLRFMMQLAERLRVTRGGAG